MKVSGKDKAKLCEMEEKRKEGRKEEEGAMQPLLQLGNKLLQPQRQPQLQKLACYVHYYLEQIYTARLAQSRGSTGWSKSERNEEKHGHANKGR